MLIDFSAPIPFISKIKLFTIYYIYTYIKFHNFLKTLFLISQGKSFQKEENLTQSNYLLWKIQMLLIQHKSISWTQNKSESTKSEYKNDKFNSFFVQKCSAFQHNYILKGVRLVYRVHSNQFRYFNVSKWKWFFRIKVADPLLLILYKTL